MVDHHLVFAAHALHIAQGFVDLSRENVHALHLHHIVGATQDHAHARIRAAARAFSGNGAGQIVRAIADERRAFLLQGGDHQFANGALGHGLAGFGIDDFKIHIVIEHMHAAVLVAADADARAIDFRQPIDVIQRNAQFAGDALAHFFAPALGTDDALFQLEFIADTAPGDLLR